MSMKGKLIGGVLQFAGKHLGSTKAYVAGIGMIFSGLAGLVGYMLPDQGIPVMDVDTALGLVVLGGTTVAGKKVVTKQAGANG